MRNAGRVVASEGERERRRRGIPLLVAAALAVLLGVVGVRTGCAAAEDEAPPPPVAAVRAPPRVVAPPADLKGTVPSTRASYGPEGGSFHVDPGFRPSRPLPKGIDVYAVVGKVVWGAGDHHARSIQGPLPPSDANAVRAAAGELLRYVRKDAPRRHLPLDPGLDLVASAAGGSASVHADLTPLKPGERPDATDPKTAADLAAELQDQLRWGSKTRRNEDP